MFRPLLAIVRFLIRKKCVLEECLYKACLIQTFFQHTFLADEIPDDDGQYWPIHVVFIIFK